MAKKISNEELCSCLITHGSIKEAAGVLHVTERTIYNMMNDEEFIEMYENVKSGILNNCVMDCHNKMIEALQCITDIMNDKEVNVQTRLLAAQTILKNGVKLYELIGVKYIHAEKREFWDYDLT